MNGIGCPAIWGCLHHFKCHQANGTGFNNCMCICMVMGSWAETVMLSIPDDDTVYLEGHCWLNLNSADGMIETNVMLLQTPETTEPWTTSQLIPTSKLIPAAWSRFVENAHDYSWMLLLIATMVSQIQSSNWHFNSPVACTKHHWVSSKLYLFNNNIIVVKSVYTAYLNLEASWVSPWQHRSSLHHCL